MHPIKVRVREKRNAHRTWFGPPPTRKYSHARGTTRGTTGPRHTRIGKITEGTQISLCIKRDKQAKAPDWNAHCSKNPPVPESSGMNS
jgi:hypothetical protein